MVYGTWDDYIIGLNNYCLPKGDDSLSTNALAGVSTSSYTILNNWLSSLSKFPDDWSILPVYREFLALSNIWCIIFKEVYLVLYVRPN